ncbi:MAG: arsenate reductase ArsC [Aeromicrobium sp.]
MTVKLDETARKAFATEIEQLASEFRGVFGIETIERFVSESIDRMQGARITDFLPLLVQRFSRERLRAFAQAENMITKEVPEVLFVCVHNSGRSQMAAGLLNKLAAGSVHVRTAGSDPVERINPAVVEVMAEVGVDLSEEFPKPLTDEFVKAADAVITMGCGDACPIYPGKRYEDWDLEDPEGKDLETVRRIRDDLTGRVEFLLGEVVGEEGSLSQ